MSETITLQEIVGYLPYKLQTLSTYDNQIRTITSIGIHDESQNVYITSEEDFRYSIGNQMPLVIPLEELTKEDCKAMGYDDVANLKYYINYINLCLQEGAILIKDYQYLLSRHYDVNNWIGRKLGLSKSEYLKTIR